MRIDESTFDPSKRFIALSKTASDKLYELGIFEGEWRDDRRLFINACREGAVTPIEGSEETHFLARMTIGGREVVLLCIDRLHAQKGEHVTVIKGAAGTEHLQQGNGRAPFSFSIN